jgi:hypothetical protein
MLVDWDIFLTYCAWKSFSVCVLGWSWYIYALWVAVLRIFLFGIHLTAVLNTILFLELTGSNGIFGDISGWFWFRNMTSSGSQHNVWQMDPLENWLLLKLDVQIPKVSGLRWAFPPSSCRACRSITSYLHQFEVQWWLSSFILQTSFLEDVNLRIISFRLCKIKRLKIFFFSPWFPASWARSRSSTNPIFYTDFSPLLDFRGSAGFGTWRISAPLFWATCRLFSIFLLFWILERFCLWILLLCLPLSFWDI